MKTCCTCKQLKNLIGFGKNKSTKDGYTKQCKFCINEYYRNNKLKFSIRAKTYRYPRKEETKIKRAEYFKTHKKEKAEYDLEYRKKNKTKFSEAKKRYAERNKNNPQFKLKRNLRRRIHHILKGCSKSQHSIDLLGCEINFYIKYLESKFQEGMNWDNYGMYGWHVDHIIPCSSFDLTDIEQQKRCFNYSNTQPLWWIDNLKKSSRVK